MGASSFPLPANSAIEVDRGGGSVACVWQSIGVCVHPGSIGSNVCATALCTWGGVFFECQRRPLGLGSWQWTQVESRNRALYVSISTGLGAMPARWVAASQAAASASVPLPCGLLSSQRAGGFGVGELVGSERKGWVDGAHCTSTTHAISLLSGRPRCWTRRCSPQPPCSLGCVSRGPDVHSPAPHCPL